MKGHGRAGVTDGNNETKEESKNAPVSHTPVTARNTRLAAPNLEGERGRRGLCEPKYTDRKRDRKATQPRRKKEKQAKQVLIDLPGQEAEANPTE